MNITHVFKIKNLTDLVLCSYAKLQLQGVYDRQFNYI